MTGMLNDRLPLRRTLLLLLSGLPGLCGCASVWWNSFLDPSQVGNFHDNDAVNEIEQAISFRDTPGGIVGATDPTPEDLVQTVEEYQISVGDQLNIRVLDLLERGAESEFSPTVDELGYIHIPQLGWLYVQGMTARELRGEIIQKLKQTGIFREESTTEPTVVISFATQLGRIYHIGGPFSSRADTASSRPISGFSKRSTRQAGSRPRSRRSMCSAMLPNPNGSLTAAFDPRCLRPRRATRRRHLQSRR